MNALYFAQSTLVQRALIVVLTQTDVAHELIIIQWILLAFLPAVENSLCVEQPRLLSTKTHMANNYVLIYGASQSCP